MPHLDSACSYHRGQRATSDGPPHLFIEKAYWRSPVQACTGLAWFIAGVTAGVLATVALL